MFLVRWCRPSVSSPPGWHGHFYPELPSRHGWSGFLDISWYKQGLRRRYLYKPMFNACYGLIMHYSSRPSLMDGMRSGLVQSWTQLRSCVVQPHPRSPAPELGLPLLITRATVIDPRLAVISDWDKEGPGGGNHTSHPINYQHTIVP